MLSIEMHATLLDIMNNGCDLGVICLSADYTILSWNSWMERHSGFCAADIKGRDLHEVFPCIRERGKDKYLDACIQDKLPVILSPILHRFFIELEIIKAKTPITMWQETRLFPCLQDDDVIGTVIIIKDLTDQILREREILDKTEKLRIEKERWQVALRGIGEGVIVMDTGGSIGLMNPMAEKMTGWMESEVGGLLMTDVIRLVTSSGRELDASAFKPGEPIQFSGGARLIDRHQRGLDIQGVLSPIEGRDRNVEGFVLVFRDESHEKQIQIELAQMQKLESIALLAGGIAHDFNNILYPIILLTEMSLVDLADTAALRENFEDILESANRAKDLIKQILTFSRMHDDSKQFVQIQPIIKESLKLLRALIPKNIQIITDIKGTGLVHANPTQIHQVVMNLITNAYQAIGGNRSGTIRIQASEILGYDSQNQEQPQLRLRFEDDGQGIEDSVLPHIFEPYYTTKKENQGSGLGLSTVFGIVKNHDGDIKVTSQTGKGTRFEIHLPVAQNQRNSADTVPPAEIPSGTERLLIVDDEINVINMLRRYLERLGYRVDEHDDSLAALSAFKQDPSVYDLVITDMAMPNMTGIDLSKAILRIRPKIPIILCTGYSEAVNAEKAAAIGIKSFLTKPLQAGELAVAVRRLIDGNNHS